MGEGKGKTTAALGLAMRALGQGLRVEIVQFCKGRDCGEHIAAQKLGLPVHRGDAMEIPTWQGATLEWRLHAQRQLETAKERMGCCDLLILDEILGALTGGFIDEEQVRELLSGSSDVPELVLTGRAAPAFVLEQADLVTEMVCAKHYYKDGVKARKGIEY